MLTNSPKTLDLTKRDVSQLNVSQNDDTIEEMCRRAKIELGTHKNVNCG